MWQAGRRNGRLFCLTLGLVLAAIRAVGQGPALTTVSEVHYRGLGRAMARVINPASIAAEQRGADDGTHGAIRHLKLPPARTSVDCENAALALLADAAAAGWTGRYETWSDFLPGNIQDIFPGDAINLNISSRTAVFQAIATEVQVMVHDLPGEHMVYQIQLVAAIAEELAFEFDATKTSAALNLTPVSNSQVGTTVLPDLIAAAVTLVSSTTANLDAGTTPPAGGGIEVRWSDFGWGPANDQNLAGRFTTQTFTLPRLAKAQDYFLRQFDTSVPPKYSRFSAALHSDYPY